MATSDRIPRAVAAVAAAMLLLAACGAEEAPADLSPTAETGRAAALRLGCASCHGNEGQGVAGLAPPWQGVFGSTVTLADGTAVVADRAYLRRSILEPGAQVVGGFTLPMPPYRPTDADLEAVLDYIEEVG